MKCLQESKQAQLVQTQQFPAYQKTGRRPGRPSLKEKVAEKVAVAEQGLRDAKVGLAMALEETKDGIAKDGIAKGVWGFGEHFVKHVRRDAQSPTAAP